MIHMLQINYTILVYTILAYIVSFKGLELCLECCFKYVKTQMSSDISTMM